MVLPLPNAAFGPFTPARIQEIFYAVYLTRVLTYAAFTAMLWDMVLTFKREV